MERGEYEFIWQHPDWPRWRYDTARLAPLLAETSRAQGLLLGRLADVGLGLRADASLAAWSAEVLKTSAIENEQLAPHSVRSSLARRLGVDIGAQAPADRQVDGVVDMVLDASRNAHAPLTAERLCAWQAALFPTGHYGLTPIKAGQWRDDAQGPMQVVSSPLGHQTVHYEAPPAARLPQEIERFLHWAQQAQDPLRESPLLRAGLAHLWFVTLHPFDDGNGRVARAVGDLFLARADGCTQRFYSLSAQIQRERDGYYAILEATQRGGLDVTEWLAWFLATLHRALDAAQLQLDQVLSKARFWQRWAAEPLNARQIKVLNRLLDGFDGPLNNRKWAAMAGCSADTALRDLNDLVAKGLLRRTEGGGRSVGYALNAHTDAHAPAPR